MFIGNAEKNKADIKANLQLFETLIETLPRQIELGHSANRRIVSLLPQARATSLPSEEMLDRLLVPDHREKARLDHPLSNPRQRPEVPPPPRSYASRARARLPTFPSARPKQRLRQQRKPLGKFRAFLRLSDKGRGRACRAGDRLR